MCASSQAVRYAVCAAGWCPYGEVQRGPLRNRCASRRMYIRLDLALDNEVSAFCWDAVDMNDTLTLIPSQVVCCWLKQAGLTSSAGSLFGPAFPGAP